MDLFKKIIGLKNNDELDQKQVPPGIKDKFRNPIWTDDYDTDDELFENNKQFGFQVFTSPSQMQQHFEEQLNEMLKTFEESSDYMEYFREDTMQPDFDTRTAQLGNTDTDLDSANLADRMSLLDRITKIDAAVVPEDGIVKSNNGKTHKKPASEAEQIMDRIHGLSEIQGSTAAKHLPSTNGKKGREFENAFQNSRIFSKNITLHTVRKPDGTYEVRRIERDGNGNVTCTVSKNVNGQVETSVTYTNASGQETRPDKHLEHTDREKSVPLSAVSPVNVIQKSRHITFEGNGYAMPKNMW